MIRSEEVPNGYVAEVKRSQLVGDVCADLLKVDIRELVAGGDPQFVVLDMSNVKMISSVVIGAFVRLNRELGENGIEFRQCAVAQLIQDIYKTMGLYGRLSLYESCEDAVAGTNRLQ